MPIEEDTHIFIIRIWLEPRELVEMPVYWRGVIEHVITGESKAFDNPNQIWRFIASYLSRAEPSVKYDE